MGQGESESETLITPHVTATAPSHNQSLPYTCPPKISNGKSKSLDIGNTTENPLIQVKSYAGSSTAKPIHPFSVTELNHEEKQQPPSEEEKSSTITITITDPATSALISTYLRRNEGMRNRASNFSDLIQRVTANCLLHPLGSTLHSTTGDEYDSEEHVEDEFHSEEHVLGNGGQLVVPDEQEERPLRDQEMETLMNQVFDAVSSMKSAYMSLQDAHNPWDPEKMRVADVAVVAELRKLAILRERFRRSVGDGGGGGKKGCGLTAGTLSDVVAPYEAAVEGLKREVKARDVEVESLREKLRSLTSLSGGGRKGRSQSKRKVSHFQRQVQVADTPVPELFEATMTQVREASKSFTSQLLSLMRSAKWDIASAVRSIEAAGATTTSVASTQHAKYALESYISRKLFQGFDHETFYMDGSLSSLLNPEQFRRDCFTQYRDMKAMDPVELLGVMPTCNFGKFCFKKYLSIFHPKMEESLFGNLEQRHQVLAGNHPRSQFYGEFLGLAKAVWLLHLLAFSLDPVPTQFEPSSRAEFDPNYMESVVKFSGGQVPEGHEVGLPVSPGFNLRNGSVVKARVYLIIPSSHDMK